jgi:hypothetical protein
MTLDLMLHTLKALDEPRKPHVYDTPAYKRAFAFVDKAYPRIAAGIAECERHVCSVCGGTGRVLPDAHQDEEPCPRCGDPQPYLDFECDACRKTFYVPLRSYRGQWDHPPNATTCPECVDEAEAKMRQNAADFAAEIAAEREGK